MFNVHVSDLYHVSVWWLVHIILGVSTKCEIVHEVCVWSSDFQPTVGKIYTDSTNTSGSTGRCSGGLFLTVLVGHVILQRCWAPDMQVNVGKAHSMFSV